MVKENQKLLNAVNVISDGILVVLSIILAYVIRFHIFHGEPDHWPVTYYINYSLLVTPLFLLLYASVGLYDSFRAKRFQPEFELLVRSNLIGTLVLIVAFFVVREMNISRWVLVIFFLISTASISCKRVLLRRALRRYRAAGKNHKRVVLVGAGAMGVRYAAAVGADPALGFDLVGCVCEGEPADGLEKLCGLEDLSALLETAEVDEVVAAPSMEENGRVQEIILACEKNGVKLSLIPYYADLMPAHPYFDEVGGLPLMNMRRVPLDNMGNAFVKRAIDIVGSALLIILTSPLMLAAAIGTRLSSPGPVIFRQERVGRGKKLFEMYKFRSMRISDDSDTAWSTDADSRRTAFGSLLRKLSIDELPQLFNVLRGQMSLVGPRPELPHFVEQFRESVPLYMIKHYVRPGITGWAQVNGLRGDTSIPDRIRCDIFYIENWSLLFDFKILLLTPFRGLVNREKLSISSKKERKNAKDSK